MPVAVPRAGSRARARDFPDERRRESERQLLLLARRGRLIQRSLTSLYIALGLFVGATVAIGAVPLAPGASWLPAALGIAGTLVLFTGCMTFIAETRLALRAMNQEMEFVEKLRERYAAREARR